MWKTGCVRYSEVRSSESGIAGCWLSLLAGSIPKASNTRARVSKVVVIDRDAHSVATHAAQIDAPLFGRGDDPRLTNPNPNRDRVEELVRFDDGTPRAQVLREGDRHQMDPLADGLEAGRAVEDGVEGCHHIEDRKSVV